MSGLRRILERAQGDPRRIALPEAEDPRVLRAACRLFREGIAEPVLVGEANRIGEAAKQAGLELGAIAVADVERGDEREGCVETLREALRLKPALDPEALGREPLYHAAALVRRGRVDGMVAGAVHSTAETLRAALRIIGTAPGARLASSFFLMELRTPTPSGETMLAYADSGLVPDPDPEQLADIAWRTAGHYRMLVGREPRVAFLSFSTLGSAEHASIDKVREGIACLRERKPDFAFDGELQLDAALIPEVAGSKAPHSPVAGRANVLIFPNLDAGNIGYKLTERIAGAQAIGPLLQGFARPVNDLSRGCSDDDIVVAAAVTAVQAAEAL